MNNKLGLSLIFLFLILVGYSSAQVTEETNINVGISLQKSFFILYDGSSFLYTVQIYNPNLYPIENLDLQFELRHADTGRFFFENKHINSLSSHQLINYTFGPYQLNKIGLYNLFINGKSNNVYIKIKGETDVTLTKIRDTFRVYPFSFSGIIAILAIIISGLSYYNNHLKVGEIIVGTPRFLKVHKPLDSALIITIPLVFENTGAYSKSISNLGLILEKEDKKYFLELYNEYEKFLWYGEEEEISNGITMDKNLKPATQFTIPAKSSITKILMFGTLGSKNFQELEYNTKLICWGDSIDDKHVLLEFKNTIKRDGVVHTLNIWEKAYEDESKIHPLKKFYYTKKRLLLKLKINLIKYKNNNKFLKKLF